MTAATTPLRTPRRFRQHGRTRAGLVCLLLMLAPIGSAIAGQNRLLEQIPVPQARGVLEFAGLGFTPEEEDQIGGVISAVLRERYGVVQNTAIHEYVTLVGQTLVADTPERARRWTFIVLDTDGVNAFATPGGYIHITRGALAVMRNEAELAGVLAHEIAHVTAQHTLVEVRRSQAVMFAAKVTRSELLDQVSREALRLVRNNLWDQRDEAEADRRGVELANAARYSPRGLTGFLSTLIARNREIQDIQGADARSGLFASHPETESRAIAIGSQVDSQSLTATATVADRFRARVPYKPVSAATLAGRRRVSPAAKPQSPRRWFPLPAPGPAPDPGALQQRNVNVEADAPGGDDPRQVAVEVSRQLREFRLGIR